MGLRDIEATLPPGFRFYPSDEELVCHYLYNKIANDNLSKGTMVEVDLHTCEPWQLPDVAKMGGKEWYFFSYRERKYATGLRTNRATSSGYWKATGKDKPVYDSNTGGIVGMRKTLVFYRDRAPNGIKTGWIMHEFRLDYIPPHLHNNHLPSSKDWVLCRVFHKSKGELGTKLSLENEFEQSMMNVSYGILDQTMQEYEYPQLLLPQCSQHNINANVSSNNNLPNLEGMSPGFLLPDQEPNEKITSSINVIDFKRGGEYGYLFDMDLDS